jgi:hypothetical protein
MFANRQSRRSQNRPARGKRAGLRSRLTVDRLEDRLVLSSTRSLPIHSPNADRVGGDAGDQGLDSFFITRIDGLAGSALQQVVAGNELLAAAGIHEGKITRPMGSKGLYLIVTDHPIDPDAFNQELSHVPGYKYLESAEGNVQTGALTNVGEGEFFVNPLAALDRTRLGPVGGVGGPQSPAPTILGSFAGMDENVNPFLLSPPDTNLAVGPNYVMEGVNLALRIYSKDGTVQTTVSLNDFFAPLGTTSAGDVVVVYDDIANRWYVICIDGQNNNNLLLAVSNDSNPLDGFAEMHKIAISPPGDLSDFPKIGFNADAVVLEANDFGSGGGNPVLTTIDKSTLLDGNSSTITSYNSIPAPNFRAMVPAQMHGTAPGDDLMYFVQEASYGNGDFVQVVQMTHVLSASPSFTYTNLQVNHYGFPPAAQQPGGQINPNDTTFENADWRNGLLVAAHSVGDPSDTDAHANWYEFSAPDSAAATPSLLQEGRLSPGLGTSTYYPTVAITSGGAIGMTYMESSPTEYASMYITGRTPGDAPGTMHAPVATAVGTDYLDGFFRAGDYSGITVDPVDHATFWAANEYKTPTAFWNTSLAHFSLGMAVTSTTPANGAIVTSPPTEYIVSFSEAYDPSQINVAGVTVNGHSATAYNTIDADTIRFTFATNPVTAQGLETFNVAAGTVVRLSDGNPVLAYTSTFRYDALRMQVTSTIPANGTVATLPLTKIRVSLNEAFAPGSVGPNDLTVSMGAVTGATIVNATTIDYLVTGLNREGTLNFSLGAGALLDTYGNPSLPYSASVTLDYGTVPFPTPTSAISPAGSLIYDTSIPGTIQPASDTDSFTITADPGQTLTVIVHPIDGSFRASVLLKGPSTTMSATASAAGNDVVIQTGNDPSYIYGNGNPKSYTVTVSGAGGTTGRYTVELLLNAAAEAEDHNGASNNTIATAQNLEGSSVILDTSNPTADRLAVVGAVRGGPVAGDTYVSVRSVNFFGGDVVRYDTNGNLVQTITNPILATGVISDVELGPNNVIYVALSTNFSGPVVQGEIVKFDIYGNLLGTVSLPDDSNVGFLYPFGFDVASDGSLWVPQLNSGNLLHVGPTGTVLASYFVGSTVPQDAAVRPDGKVLVSQGNSPTILLLDPGTGTFTPFAFDSNFNPVDLNLTPTGDTWLGDFYGPTKFDSSGNQTQYIPDFGTIDPQVDPSGNLWVANFYFGTVDRFSSAGAYQFSAPVPGGSPLGVAVLGIDSTSPLPTPDVTDYYSFHLGAGQSATIVVNLLSGTGVNVELDDASGNTLAVGTGDRINDFVAQATGIYYVKVTGNGARYSLVVTRNASFDSGVNGTLANAQNTIGTSTDGTNTSGRRVVLGNISQGGENFDSGSLNGYTVAASPFGSDVNMTVTAAAAHDGPYGLQVLDGNGWEYKDTDSTHLKQGDSFSFWLQPNSVAGGRLYVGFGATASGTLSIVAAPNSSEFLIQRNAGYGFETLGTVSQSWQANQWYKVQVNWGTDGSITAKLYGSDGATLLNTVTGSDNTVTSGGIAFRGFGSVWYVDTYSFGGSSDFYKLQLSPGQQLSLSVLVPAWNTGEYVNNLDPAARLYDPSGHVVQTDDNPSIRTASLQYRVPSGAGGTYVVEIFPSTHTPKPTQGEYVLDIQALTTPLPAFAVTATVPPNGASLYTPPPDVTVHFNNQFNLTTLQASDLKIDNLPATGVTIQDGSTADFTAREAYQYGGHYYLLTSAAKSWTDAQAQAAALGGNLVTIGSQGEQEFLKKVLLSGAHRSDNYWTGLNDIGSPTTYHWASGESVGYTNWGPGAPFNLFPGADAAIINVYPDVNHGAWVDYSTSTLLYGIIELNSLPAGWWVASEGTHSVTIAAGAIKDVQGTPISAYNGSFTLDYTAPRVVGSSIQEGAVLPTGNLTYTVTFSEPLQTALVDAGDFSLVGQYRNSSYSPTSFSFDATGKILTINYSNLLDDSYTLTLFSNPNSFVDQVGLELDGEPTTWPIPPNQSGDGFEGGNFFVHFVTDFATQALPTPFVGIAPAGSQVYRPPSNPTGVIGFPGDTDSFTVTLDPGQTITVAVAPSSPGLAPSVQIFGPGNVLLGSASALADQTALLQTVPATAGGLYTITVGSTGGTLGLYSVGVLLNAAKEAEGTVAGVDDNSQATAQSLDSAFTDQGNGMARAAVVGTSDGGGGYTATAVPYSFIDISSTGTPTLQFTDDSVFFLDLSGSGFSFPFYGQNYTGVYYSTNGLITFGSGNGEYSNQDLTSDPIQAAIAPLWDDMENFSQGVGAVYYQLIGTQLVIQWNDMSYYFGSAPVITFEAILNEADGSIQFNYQNLSAGVFNDEGASATVGIKDAGPQGSNRVLLDFNSGPNAYVGSGKSTLIQTVPPTVDYYKVTLTAGQAVNLALADLDGSGVTLDLIDPSNNDTSGTPTGNASAAITNYIAPSSGVYYIEVGGSVVHNYDLVVTRNAVFDAEPNDTQGTAQSVAGGGGAVGAIVNTSSATVGTTIEGLAGAETGGYIPPDVPAAVGPNNVVECANIAIRIFDKAGNALLTEPLDTFFAPLGVPSAGDPFITYDDGAGRWYIGSIDGASNNNLLLAVSNDSNPLDGFTEMHRISITPAGDLADFPKIGFNADAVFLEANDFIGGQTGGNPAVVTIAKASLLDQNSSTITSYSSTPRADFRAMVPAQMHGAGPAGTEYFIQERSYGDGGAIEVVTMTNYLSTTPTFVYTDLAVQAYTFPPLAQQPGGTSATNDTTFTQLDWRNGKMVAAHTVGLASDPNASKVRWYQIDTTGASPVLLQQGNIDPGAGISTYFGTIAQDNAGNIAVNYMESSSSEPISMYIAGKAVGTTPGVMGPGVDVAPGLGFNYYSQFRNGDFSSLVLDPTDGTTFWAANEYSGTDFLWNTKIASFQVALHQDSDWYSVAVPSGGSLTLTANVPANGPGEFVNGLVPRIELWNGGTLVSSAQGVGAVLTTGALAGGTYTVRITSVGSSGGEYALSIQDPPAHSSPHAPTPNPRHGGTPTSVTGETIAVSASGAARVVSGVTTGTIRGNAGLVDRVFMGGSGSEELAAVRPSSEGPPLVTSPARIQPGTASPTANPRLADWTRELLDLVRTPGPKRDTDWLFARLTVAGPHRTKDTDIDGLVSALGEALG